MDKLSAEELWQLKHNFSSARESSEEHFFRCWNHQDCKVCLAEDECSWCPMTSACVPNPYAIPLLAPAYDENICPHWAERWELRTKPLGCQVSTITSLTSIISIVSTFVVVLLVALIVLGVRWGRRRSKQDPDWWRLWKRDWSRVQFWQRPQEQQDSERDPLLGQAQSTRDGR
ncbi:plexin repeat domain-containing protein [Colletotrichum scovillei]|uniref:Plexin repeat domain-containing protein n=1 Tax=Colletotrichum scovillei TaxID=1209932 RepID=A0A9P7UF08_9PEZI|nr:plexin repeat domain-containing protein [Colletotrichum scovillei]KAG7069231.1 plexin repeat domain-containing protein [Colletotrichum scovillei]KAG7073210.1 plexin repeat domain-containing protein [Colletotrichum scovillei]